MESEKESIMYRDEVKLYYRLGLCTKKNQFLIDSEMITIPHFWVST